MTPQEEKVLQGRKMLEEVLERVKDDLTIAKFLGATVKEWYTPNIDSKQCGNYAEFPTTKENGIWHDNKAFHGIEYLKYSKDWNWLMKAIEKIESLNCEVKIGQFEDEFYYTYVFCYNHDIKSLYEEHCKTYNAGVISRADQSKIKSAYITVVKFIEFYNSIKDKL